MAEACEQVRLEGQVFIRTGAKEFKVADSGLFLPIEVVKGASAAAWETGAVKLRPRVEHEVQRMSKGAIK